MNMIEVEKLSRNFKQLVAVDKVSFQVREGEIFGFLGPNGAGKTTTINILCTLLKPTSGRAYINGFDVVRQQSQVRQEIGLVFQDPSLDDKLSGIQNLNFHAMVYNIPSSQRKQRIEQVLHMVELWERRDSFVETYSGGMKRRLELARGLLHRPRVLFLDEPTLGLDPQTRTRIWEYIIKMCRQEGTTIFLTTHYMDEAEKAGRIAIIDKGRIVALDTPRKLKKMVGQDVISVKTEDDVRAIEEIKAQYQIEARVDDGGLTFSVKNGDEFLPKFVQGIETNILSVNLRRPSLDDVFLKLTGRELRDEESKDYKSIAHHRGMRRH
ncbi:MAG: ATP-binding cassette domain-containing protein [Dehalococcoidia bacterium]|nr:MAG: ATP-binding cassette domain-containing protein [Dehalococcoidia bacterium]